jgi:DNA-binding transcriptional LysR family regulator
MPDLDPHLLRAFLKVADVGTVSGAAAALNRTQAAVSMQIRRLEEVIGSPLFERSPKGLAPTENGVLLLPYAREILRLNDDVGQRIQGKRLAGRVRLGVVEDFAATRLIDILKAYRDLNPQVHIDIIVDSNRSLAAAFEQEQLDIAICDTMPLSRKPIRIWDERLLWVVRRGSACAQERPLPIIMFDGQCPWRAPAMAALSDPTIHWRLVSEASTLVGMIAAVRSGIGIGLMIESTIPEDCIPLDQAKDNPGSVSVQIGMYARSEISAPVRHLAEFIIGQIGLPRASRADPFG